MDSSPFNRLSAELRIMIYEFALHDPRGIVFTYCPQADRLLEQRVPGHGLILACRQLKMESLPILLKINTFKVRCKDPTSETSRPNAPEMAFNAIKCIRRGLIELKDLSNCIREVELSLRIKWSKKNTLTPSSLMKILEELANAFPDPDVALNCRFDLPCVPFGLLVGVALAGRIQISIDRGNPEKLRLDLSNGFDQRIEAIRMSVQSGVTARMLLSELYSVEQNFLKFAELVDEHPFWKH